MPSVLDPLLVPVEVADEVGGGAVDHGVGHAELLDVDVASVLCKQEKKRRDTIKDFWSGKLYEARRKKKCVMNSPLSRFKHL